MSSRLRGSLWLAAALALAGAKALALFATNRASTGLPLGEDAPAAVFFVLEFRCRGIAAHTLSASSNHRGVARYLTHIGAKTVTLASTRVSGPVRVELEQLPPDDWV
jgi:hypothetical protein